MGQGVVGVRSRHAGLRGTDCGGLGADGLREHPSRFLARTWLRRATDRIAMIEAIGCLSLRLGLSLSLRLRLNLRLSLGLGLGLGLGLSLRLGYLDLSLSLNLGLSLCV